MTNECNIREKLSKKACLYIGLTILFTLMILYMFSNKVTEIHYSINVFCATLGISLGLISLIRDSNSYYKYIGIGFLFIGVTEYVTIIFQLIEMNPIIILKFIIANKTLEASVILTSTIMYIKKYTNLKAIKVYIVFTIIIFTTVVVILGGVPVRRYLSGARSIDFFMKLILLITTIVYVKKYRKEINDKLTYVYVFLIAIFMHQILYKPLLTSGDYSLILSNIFKGYAYFKIYMGIKKYILKIQYEDIKEKLIISRAKQSEFYIKLKERSIVLQELNSINNKNEKRYCNLIDSFKEGIGILSRGRLVYANKQMIDILEVQNKESIMGKELGFFVSSICYKGYIKNEITSKYSKLDSKIKKVFQLINLKDKSKELELYLVDNGMNREIIYIRDLTEINEYNDFVKLYNEYLKEEEIKNEFYSNISHELRTPINIINSALTVNEIYLKEKNLENLKKNNLVIKQNCLRLIRTINNFIDANKASEGYLKVSKKVHNIVEVVENVVTATARYADKISNSLVFDSIYEEIYMEIDKNMIERVILNILSNSVKYGERNKQIKVNIYMKTKKVYIIIQNHTKPIKKEYEKYIFDKFTTVNKSFNREKEGSGLGLYLSKAMIELHGGNIKFKSNCEFGNRFIIELPIYETSKACKNIQEQEIFALEKKVDVEFSDIYI